MYASQARISKIGGQNVAVPVGVPAPLLPPRPGFPPQRDSSHVGGNGEVYGQPEFS
jgi:hypothetical protein